MSGKRWRKEAPFNSQNILTTHFSSLSLQLCEDKQEAARRSRQSGRRSQGGRSPLRQAEEDEWRARRAYRCPRALPLELYIQWGLQAEQGRGGLGVGSDRFHQSLSSAAQLPGVWFCLRGLCENLRRTHENLLLQKQHSQRPERVGL